VGIRTNIIMLTPKETNIYDFMPHFFEVGKFIKLKTWDKYRLKIIDKGSIYFIVEHEDGTLGWSEIDCDWMLSENQEDWKIISEHPFFED